MSGETEPKSYREALQLPEALEMEGCMFGGIQLAFTEWHMDTCGVTTWNEGNWI